jgi:hypothetical protein
MGGHVQRTPRGKGSPGIPKKTDVSGLQTFLRDKYVVWASNGSSVEEIWNNFKNVVYEGIERFVPHKILKKIRIPNITTRR